MRSILLVGSVLAAAIGFGAARVPQLPQKYTNLQVFPKDVPQAALISAMRSFAISLGTRCEHCHVGEGNDLSKFDFASDAKPEKATARRMMGIMTTVNSDLLKGIGDPAQPVKVTCYTCHRGALKPATAPPAGPGAPR